MVIWWEKADNLAPLYVMFYCLFFVTFTCGVLGVVLDCINFRSLPSFLLWISELFCLCCVAALQVSSRFVKCTYYSNPRGFRVQSPSIIPFPGYPLCLVPHLRPLDGQFWSPVVWLLLSLSLWTSIRYLGYRGHLLYLPLLCVLQLLKTCYQEPWKGIWEIR